MQKIIIVAIIANLVFPSSMLGCLWDYDTIMVERKTFPTVNELIAGYFVRHSDAYYQWRIEDRTSRGKPNWTPEAFDDVAVAYDKLNQSEKAIETIREKQTRYPDYGQYETAANLGTFLIHAGRLQEGLVQIKAAIEINPDAHFGREKYQQLLVEYLISKKGTSEKAKSGGKELTWTGNDGFDQFVLDSQEIGTGKKQQAEIDRAIKGVSGMMRFGKFDSPILLEALGDLLDYGEAKDAKRLAARAYLKAAMATDDQNLIQLLRDKATRTIKMQDGTHLGDIEEKLKEEIEVANVFFAQISADEKAWITVGNNVDEKFEAKYYMEPKLVHSGKTPAQFIFAAVALLVVGAYLFIRIKQKKALAV